jgi:glucose-6-phosphate-specific signal transduction histidine kinase
VCPTEYHIDDTKFVMKNITTNEKISFFQRNFKSEKRRFKKQTQISHSHSHFSLSHSHSHSHSLTLTLTLTLTLIVTLTPFSFIYTDALIWKNFVYLSYDLSTETTSRIRFYSIIKHKIPPFKWRIFDQ